MVASRQEGNYKLFQLLNIIGFVGMVVINFLANYLPINQMDTGYISDLYPNLFTPAPFTFAIWGLIYLLLGIFVIYQAQGIMKQGGGQSAFVNRIGYLFFSSCIFNMAWIMAWHYLKIWLSLLIMILLLINLIILYQRVNSASGRRAAGGSLIARIPFSIYLGWITIATVANVTAFLVAVDWGGFGLSDSFWMVLVTLVATAIVISFMFSNRDWVYSLVALWAFFGIISERLNTEPVETAVVVVVALCMVVIAAGILKLIMDNRREEGAMY